MSCLRRDLNQQHTAYRADALPTEPPRQLSWAGRIFTGHARTKGISPLVNRVTLSQCIQHAHMHIQPPHTSDHPQTSYIHTSQCTPHLSSFWVAISLLRQRKPSFSKSPICLAMATQSQSGVGMESLRGWVTGWME